MATAHSHSEFDHLIESWQLPDGTRVTIRPIRPDDLALETAFVDGLSHEASYNRLFSPRHLQPEELWRFTHIDYEREMALIATACVDGRERQIAVARYVRDDEAGHEQAAEAAFAIVVGDEWQGTGLGTRLMRKLIATAKAAGVRRLADVTLSTNEGMRALSRKLGFTVKRDPRDATITRLTLDL
ncbi:hypothetical protein BH11PSE9_BH11PSE9_36330 [soil metagenome]